MTLDKKDFVEIEFTGRVKDGDVFDSNIKKELEKLHQGHEHAIEAKPVVVCLGEGMFLKAIDDFLVGKELGDYEIELSPEKAFGFRMPQLVQKVPMKLFTSQKLNPFPGAVFNFDGKTAKVLSVSGGRVMVDFNHPLAGKNVSYEVHVLRKVEDLNEKINAFVDFVFRREMNFSIEDKKIVIEVEKPIVKFVEMFRDKFREIFNMDLEIRQKAEPLANSPESQIKETEEKPKAPQ